jgi:hypothetical protein
LTIFLVLLLFFIPSHNIFAGVFLNYSTSTESFSDDAEHFKFSTLKNIFFIGTGLGSKEQLIVGPSFALWSKSSKANAGAQNSDLTIREIGPQISYFFTEERNLGISCAYHPYLRGNRTLASNGSNEKIAGSSLFFNIFYHFKVTDTFYAGASMNYKSISIDRSTTNSGKTTVSQATRSYFPAFEFNLRF